MVLPTACYKYVKLQIIISSYIYYYSNIIKVHYFREINNASKKILITLFWIGNINKIYKYKYAKSSDY